MSCEGGDVVDVGSTYHFPPSPSSHGTACMSRVSTVVSTDYVLLADMVIFSFPADVQLALANC